MEKKKGKEKNENNKVKKKKEYTPDISNNQGMANESIHGVYMVSMGVEKWSVHQLVIRISKERPDNSRLG